MGGKHGPRAKQDVVIIYSGKVYRKALGAAAAPGIPAKEAPADPAALGPAFTAAPEV